MAGEHFAQTCYLADGILYKWLSAETRIDRHDEYKVDNVNYLFEHCHRGGRIDCHAGKHAGIANLCKGAVEMSARFIMHIHQSCSAVSYFRDISSRLINHHVDIKRLFRHLSDSLYYRKSDGDIRYKITVHHIDMQAKCLA